MFYFLQIQDIKFYFFVNIQKLIHKFDILHNTVLNFIESALKNFNIM